MDQSESRQTSEKEVDVIDVTVAGEKFSCRRDQPQAMKIMADRITAALKGKKIVVPREAGFSNAITCSILDALRLKYDIADIHDAFNGGDDELKKLLNKGTHAEVSTLLHFVSVDLRTDEILLDYAETRALIDKTLRGG